MGSRIWSFATAFLSPAYNDYMLDKSKDKPSSRTTANFLTCQYAAVAGLTHRRLFIRRNGGNFSMAPVMAILLQSKKPRSQGSTEDHAMAIASTVLSHTLLSSNKRGSSARCFALAHPSNYPTPTTPLSYSMTTGSDTARRLVRMPKLLTVLCNFVCHIQAFEQEMQSFFLLFNRFLSERVKKTKM